MFMSMIEKDLPTDQLNNKIINLKKQLSVQKELEDSCLDRMKLLSSYLSLKTKNLHMKFLAVPFFIFSFLGVLVLIKSLLVLGDVGKAFYLLSGLEIVLLTVSGSLIAKIITKGRTIKNDYSEVSQYSRHELSDELEYLQEKRDLYHIKIAKISREIKEYEQCLLVVSNSENIETSTTDQNTEEVQKDNENILFSAVENQEKPKQIVKKI